MLCIGDSRFVKQEGTKTSLSEVLGCNHTLSKNGLRAACESDESSCTALMDIASSTLAKTNQGHSDIVLSIGGNDLISCVMKEGSADALDLCAEKSAKVINDRVSEVAASPICNEGGSCSIFLIGAHALPRVPQVHDQHAQVCPALDNVVSSNPSSTLISLCDVALDQDDFIDLIHLNDQGTQKVASVMKTHFS